MTLAIGPWQLLLLLFMLLFVALVVGLVVYLVRKSNKK